MKPSRPEMMEQGRAIARAMDKIKVDRQKNKARAVERREILLHTAAEQALSGNNKTNYYGN